MCKVRSYCPLECIHEFWLLIVSRSVLCPESMGIHLVLASAHHLSIDAPIEEEVQAIIGVQITPGADAIASIVVRVLVMLPVIVATQKMP
eukprot:gene13421-biopygen3635